MSSLRDKILAQYPSFAFLLNDPEIGKLLRDAVDPNKGFSSTTFLAKIQETHWWKSQSESQRTWLTQSATDPGEAAQQRRGMRAGIAQQAARYGIRLTTNQLNFLSELALQRGLSPDDPQVIAAFPKLLTSKNAVAGMRKTSAKDVQQMARREYAYQMSNKNAAYWGDQMARGLKTQDDVRTMIAEHAAQLYPQFAAGLKQGQSIANLTDSYREIIANELELDPEAIDFTQGRWSKVMQYRNTDGKLRAPTAHEIQLLARSDDRWWGTSKGRETDASMAQSLLQTFGMRKAS